MEKKIKKIKNQFCYTGRIAPSPSGHLHGFLYYYYYYYSSFSLLLLLFIVINIIITIKIIKIIINDVQ